jgi:hypothetical protein
VKWTRSDDRHQGVRHSTEPSSVDPRPAPRSRSAVENDLRGLLAIRAWTRRGDRPHDQVSREAITRRTDRLLDELLSLRQGDG